MSGLLTLLSALIEARGNSQREECQAFNARAAADHERDAALSIRTLRRWINGIVASAARVDAALRRPAVAASPVAHTIRGAIEAFTRVPAAELPR